jgi:hypothetical protein
MLTAILAWYTLVICILAFAGNIATNQHKGGYRLLAVLTQLPVFLFALLYLLN